MTLQELFIQATIRANSAKTESERLIRVAEREGVKMAIDCIFGDVGVGSVLMAADNFYLSVMVNRPMTGGLWHDWVAAHNHVAVYDDDGNLTDDCGACRFNLRDPIHNRIDPKGNPL